MPMVSVIIAAYNPGPFLEPTIRSIIDQTFTDWELILVDDGSSQDLAPLAHLHPRITFIRQPNRGLSIARNVGIMRSSADLLAFSDHDDVWLPEKLAIQVEEMRRNPELGLCYSNFERIDSQGKHIGPGWTGGAERYVDLLRGCCVCVSTTMVRRDALTETGYFDPLYLGSQDYDMWLKIARERPVKYLPQVLAYYRQHGNNVSRRYAELYPEIQHIYRRHLELAKLRKDREAVSIVRHAMSRTKRVYGAQAFDQCRESLHALAAKPFFHHLGWAFRLAPVMALQSLATYPIRKLEGRKPQPAQA